MTLIHDCTDSLIAAFALIAPVDLRVKPAGDLTALLVFLGLEFLAVHLQ